MTLTPHLDLDLSGMVRPNTRGQSGSGQTDTTGHHEHGAS